MTTVTLPRMLLIPLLAGWLLQAFSPASAEGRSASSRADAGGQTVSPTTGTITGRLRDATGGVMPGVSIVVSGAALMGARETITDEDGRYRIVALPPGEYVLVFARDQFTSVTRQGVYVGPGFTASVDVTLEIATRQDNVIVEDGLAVIDSHSTAIIETFDRRQLASLPSARSMWALQGATPAVHMARLDVGGSAAATPSATTAYGTTGLNRPMVEGISVTGINPTGFIVDYGAFDQVSVRTAAHGPEWHTPGVHMEFIAKSGGDQYRGTLYAGYQDRRLQAFNIDDAQLAAGVQGGRGLGARDTNRGWSYHDINADAGGYVRKERFWWYSSVRRQQVAARQVNFPVRPLDTFLTNYSGKTTSQITQNNRIIAFVQAGRNHQPNRLTPFVAGAAAVHEAEEATAEQRALGWIGKIEWNSIVRNQLFVELRGGQFGANRPETPNGMMPRFEDVGTSIVSGGNRDWEQSFRRTQLLGSVSHFKAWIGQHHLKAGGEIFRTVETETWRSAYPGDVLHVLRNGDPIEVYLFETPSRSISGLWTYSGYASDSWRLNGSITLNLGLRFDRYRVFLPRQDHPPGRFNPTGQSFPAVDSLIAWNVIVPRIGAIYNLADNGKTLAKLSYGRYRIAPGTLVGFNANPNSNQWWRRHVWKDADGSGVWKPGEQGPELQRRGGLAVESLDPALTLPIHDEIAVWLEHEWSGSIGIRSGVVWRSARQPWARQNLNQPFEAFTILVTIPDPGPDMLLGTHDDGPALRGFNLRPEFLGLPQANIVRNVPGADSHYWTWDITATRRFGGRWSLTAGFAHTWNRDQSNSYAGQTVRANPYPLTPNDLINAGPNGRHEFTTWTAKAYGTYRAPGGFMVTPLFRHQSGQPFGRTFLTTTLNYGSVRVLAEPIGTRRMDNITILDVRVERAFPLPGSRRLAGFIDMFNLLNANPELNMNWSSGIAFLRPLAILPPRIARIGTKVEW